MSEIYFSNSFMLVPIIPIVYLPEVCSILYVSGGVYCVPTETPSARDLAYWTFVWRSLLGHLSRRVDVSSQSWLSLEIQITTLMISGCP